MSFVTFHHWITPPKKKKKQFNFIFFLKINRNQHLPERWRKSLYCQQICNVCMICHKSCAHAISQTHAHCSYCWVGHWNWVELGRLWRCHYAVQIPTRYHLCSASGFYPSDRSAHFQCRNLSAAYHHSSFSQGHNPFPYPWSRIPGLYSHCALWISAFTQLQASKETCLSGKAAFTQQKNKPKKHAEYK